MLLDFFTKKALPTFGQCNNFIDSKSSLSIASGYTCRNAIPLMNGLNSIIEFKGPLFPPYFGPF